ncbi:hypothetical protein [Streptomyces avidinii]
MALLEKALAAGRDHGSRSKCRISGTPTAQRQGHGHEHAGLCGDRERDREARTELADSLKKLDGAPEPIRAQAKATARYVIETFSTFNSR